MLDINKYMNIIHLLDWQEPNLVSFDFDDTLCFTHGRPNKTIVDKVVDYHNNGYQCIIVTARNHEHESEDWYRANEPLRIPVMSFLKLHNLPIAKIYFTNHALKGPILKNLNVIKHYDDKDEEIESAKKCGIQAIKVAKD